jgi:hypothetical protein
MKVLWLVPVLARTQTYGQGFFNMGLLKQTILIISDNCCVKLTEYQEELEIETICGDPRETLIKENSDLLITSMEEFIREYKINRENCDRDGTN